MACHHITCMSYLTLTILIDRFLCFHVIINMDKQVNETHLTFKYGVIMGGTIKLMSQHKLFGHFPKARNKSFKCDPKHPF